MGIPAALIFAGALLMITAALIGFVAPVDRDQKAWGISLLVLYVIGAAMIIGGLLALPLEVSK